MCAAGRVCSTLVTTTTRTGYLQLLHRHNVHPTGEDCDAIQPEEPAREVQVW